MDRDVECFFTKLNTFFDSRGELEEAFFNSGESDVNKFKDFLAQQSQGLVTEFEDLEKAWVHLSGEKPLSGEELADFFVSIYGPALETWIDVT